MKMTAKEARELMTKLGLKMAEDIPDDEVMEVDASVDSGEPAKMEDLKRAFMDKGPYMSNLFTLGNRLNALIAELAVATRKILPEADREKREAMAHDLLHEKLSALSGTLDAALMFMPCMTGGDETPPKECLH